MNNHSLIMQHRATYFVYSSSCVFLQIHFVLCREFYSLILSLLSIFDQVEEEYQNPNSVKRIPAGKFPQMWGQSLYVVANLVKEVSWKYVSV